MSDAARQRKSDYVAVFGSEAGRRVLKDLMQTFHIFTPVSTPDRPNWTHFHDGQRSVVIHLMNEAGLEYQSPQAFAREQQHPPWAETQGEADHA